MGLVCQEAARGTGLNIDFLMLNCNPEMLKQHVCKAVLPAEVKAKAIALPAQKWIKSEIPTLNSFALRVSTFGINLLVMFCVGCFGLGLYCTRTTENQQQITNVWFHLIF